MPTLKLVPMPYPTARLQQWRDKNYRMLTSSGASEYLKKILVLKAKERPGTRRFFGEAYVATKIAHQEGYYGSFKWLTSAKFIDGGKFSNGPTRKYKEQFRDALQHHFTKLQLRRLQQSAHRLRGRKPVPPDLWLIDRRGNHRFIEVKLPGDRLGPQQLAGLAAIACCLPGKQRVSVEIIELHAGGVSESDKRRLRKLCQRSRRAGQSKRRAGRPPAS